MPATITYAFVSTCKSAPYAVARRLPIVVLILSCVNHATTAPASPVVNSSTSDNFHHENIMVYRIGTLNYLLKLPSWSTTLVIAHFVPFLCTSVTLYHRRLLTHGMICAHPRRFINFLHFFSSIFLEKIMEKKIGALFGIYGCITT
jgi:hypothetical protein